MSDGATRTWMADGKQFHARAATTGNARLSKFDRQTGESYELSLPKSEDGGGP